MRRRYYEIIKLLPPYLLYEEVESIAREHGLNPIELFLLLNDKYIMKERPDIFKEIKNIEDDIDDIEDIEDLI